MSADFLRASWPHSSSPHSWRTRGVISSLRLRVNARPLPMSTRGASPFSEFGVDGACFCAYIDPVDDRDLGVEALMPKANLRLFMPVLASALMASSLERSIVLSLSQGPSRSLAAQKQYEGQQSRIKDIRPCSQGFCGIKLAESRTRMPATGKLDISSVPGPKNFVKIDLQNWGANSLPIKVRLCKGPAV